MAEAPKKLVTPTDTVVPQKVDEDITLQKKPIAAKGIDVNLEALFLIINVLL